MIPIRILITAGPTIEPIDPIRFISNLSTGLLGYEVAKEAKKRHYKVTLITGPTHIAPPSKIKLLRIENARELQRELIKELKKNDVLIMASAVSDYRPASFSKKKIKSNKMLTLKLAANPDILGSIPKKERKNKILIGFALETENLLKNAVKKAKAKGLDLIIANRISKKNVPFGMGPKTVYVIDRKGNKDKLEKASKSKIAGAILDRVNELCYTRNWYSYEAGKIK